ncbi:Protein CELLULOSE SYNTHASE INTERACTIVE [Trichinella spiralis]|uniref:Protein CELLULOSE SYNTHASE INTERACTIVE n=1 Tax=Trichinella spiralis TaxID=6334 RepID=A0ABR3KN79_TRISP
MDCEPCLLALGIELSRNNFPSSTTCIRTNFLTDVRAIEHEMIAATAAAVWFVSFIQMQPTKNQLIVRHYFL